ncbi:MAG: CHAT domain-containing protein, partial [Acidobacteriota bacterium]
QGISVQRLGREAWSRELTALQQKLFAASPWLAAMARLASGLSEPKKVIPLAEDPEEECQAHYYSGARCVTEGNFDCAREHFRLAASSGAECVEQVLAAVEAEGSFPEPLEHSKTDRKQLARQAALLLEKIARDQHAEAADLGTRALEQARRGCSSDDPLRVSIASHLAMARTLLGDFSGARPLLEDALQASMAAGGCVDESAAAMLNNSGFYCRCAGDPETAKALYREASRILTILQQTETANFATTLTNLAFVHVVSDEPEEALPLYRQAASTRRALFGDQHPAYAGCLVGLGHVLRQIGDLEQARETLQRSVQIYERHAATDRLVYAGALENLAALEYLLAEYDGAARHFRGAAEAYEQVGGPWQPEVAHATSGLAAVYAATGREPAALELMLRAIEQEDRLIAQVFGVSDESRRLSFLEDAAGVKDMLLSLVTKRLASSERAIHVAADVALKRKALAAEAAAFQRDFLLSGRYPQLAPKIDRLRALREKTVRAIFRGPGTEGVAAHRGAIEAWNAERQRIELELAREIPSADLAGSLTTVDASAVAGALTPGSVHIEFIEYEQLDFAQREPGQAWSGREIVAFVIPAGKDERISMVALGSAERIDQRVASFRAAITGSGTRASGRDLGLAPPATEDDVLAAGQNLREAVFDPLREALRGRERIVIAPDGSLSRLPFEALPDETGQHLVDRFAVSYLGAGRDALRLDLPRAEAGAALVMAAPDFDLVESGAGDASVRHETRTAALLRAARRFEPLPGTHREGERVAAALGVEPRMAAAATEGQLKRARSPRVLHLATHGFFLEDQAIRPLALESFERGIDGASRMAARFESPLLRSGLAFAGANAALEGRALPQDAEDGIVTSEDVVGIDLSGTQLVVLSACETGLGEIRTGEGVIGLRRAFVLAGAATLIMSLWKVPDEPTQRLMEYFYSALVEGFGRADALREAQRRLKESHPHPFFWGAFICQGDPGPLPVSAGGPVVVEKERAS